MVKQSIYFTLSWIKNVSIDSQLKCLGFVGRVPVADGSLPRWFIQDHLFWKRISNSIFWHGWQLWPFFTRHRDAGTRCPLNLAKSSLLQHVVVQRKIVVWDFLISEIQLFQVTNFVRFQSVQYFETGAFQWGNSHTLQWKPWCEYWFLVTGKLRKAHY